MKHLGLFEGIGGFSLAARWMGWETIAWCEWNEFGQKILRHHFPKAEGYGDITKTDFKKYEGKVDIITGGFPCQPFSLAGKRKGTDDERYLWHEMLRAIQEIKPTFVIAENVFGITNIDGGLVFEQVCLDLEAEGYEVQPFILPAAAKDAPHRRDRCWFVAYSKVRRINGINGNNNGQKREDRTRNDKSFCISKEWDATYTNRNGFNECNGKHEINPSEGGFDALNDIEQNVINSQRIRRNEVWNEKFKFSKTQQKECRKEQFSGTISTPNRWDRFPTQSPICNGDDGISNRLVGITFPKWRKESIKAMGNAIVPQVAFELFQALHEMQSKPDF